MADQTKVLAGLNTSYDTLKAENETWVAQMDGLLEDQKNEWTEKRQRENNAFFEDGFKHYASGCKLPFNSL